MLGHITHAGEDANEDLGLLDSQGGWHDLGKLRQQGLGDGEELRGLGLGWGRVRKGEAALWGFWMALIGAPRRGIVGVSHSVRGQEDVARGLFPVISTQYVVVTVRIPSSGLQALVCPAG